MGEDTEAQVTFYGVARDFVKYRGHEAIIHGPAETGKSFSALWYVHLCALKYAGASIVVARKVLNDIYSSAWQTYFKKIIGGDFGPWRHLCSPYGGTDRPSKVNYTNGATVWLAGFDRSSKILSADHDMILIVQAEEASLEDWETATTRTTGRAGNMPYSRLMGDANPAYPTHWMYHRDSLRLFYSRHDENPVLFDQRTGEITEQGERTMSILRRLTGVRRARLLEGKPAMAEGAIYTEYSEGVHRVYRKKAPQSFARYVAGVDWGYRNPGAMGIYGVTGDDEMVLVAQWYRAGRRDDWWLEKALEANREFGVEAFACDPSEPAYIDAFREAGLNAVKGFNAVLPGINAVKRRLADGTLTFVRDSLREPDQARIRQKLPARVEDEIPGYVWAGGAKERPVKEDDHGLDQLRYAVAYVDGLGEERAPDPAGEIADVPMDSYLASGRKSRWR